MHRLSPLRSAIVFCAASMLFLPSTGDASDTRARQSWAAEAERKAEAQAHDQEKWERDPIAFTARERSAIRNYYRDTLANPVAWIPRRAADLCPRLRKRLRKNAILPTGLRKRLEPFAGDVEDRLNTLPRGYARGMMGQDALLVEHRTQRIMDIIRNVTGPR
jgi:hypothetical protein